MKQLLPRQSRKINLISSQKNLNKNSINSNSLNKSNLLKSKDDIYFKSKYKIFLNSKNSPMDTTWNKRTYFKNFFKSMNKNNENQLTTKNHKKLNKSKNFVCDTYNSKNIRYANPIKEVNFEKNNDIKKVILTSAIYDDVKLRNIINLWNELEVIDSYRKYFFFIYNELDEEDQNDLYLNEINELIQLKNDIKNLTYNIELRIGLIKILSELNIEMNSSQKEKIDKFVLDEMSKKLEDLTIHTINIVKYMKAIKTIINQTPNLGKYNIDFLAHKFNFDKNYIIKMKLETNFLREGYAKDFFNFKNDQSPFFVRATDKNNTIEPEKENKTNYIISLDQKIINEIKECNFYIYKELISYENDEIHRTIQRCISPIKKNSSAYNFYTNINFFTKEDKSDKLVFNMKANGKGFIFNNNNINYNNKNNSIGNMNNYDRFPQDLETINRNNNIIVNNKNKTIESKIRMKGDLEKKNKNADFINFQSDNNKQKYIVKQNKNESDIGTPKFIEYQNISPKTSSFKKNDNHQNDDKNV